MSTNVYKLISEIGTGYAMYTNEILETAYFEPKLSAREIDSYPGAWFPIHEQDLTGDHTRTNSIFKKYQLLVPRTVAEKVAMFCIVHKQEKRFAYNAGKVEKANLKGVSVTRELLDAYFKNTAFPLSNSKTMADYVKHYNTVRDLVTNGTPKKVTKEFPDVYDFEAEKRLKDDVSKLQRYWAHLRALGWKKIGGVWMSPESLKQ
jgi:hypothetical protein